MPASQHQKPKSDIEISQEAKKRPIIELAKERLGIGAESLEPYGHYKAKVSMDYVKSLAGKKDGKLSWSPRSPRRRPARARPPRPSGLDRRAQRIGKTRDALPARAVARAVLRRQGRRHRRRLRASRADGRHQPAFHRRFPRHHLGAQSARGADRQSHLLGQRARHRQPPRRLAARAWT